MHFDEMENALDRANKKNYRQVLDRRTTNASNSVNNFMMSNVSALFLFLLIFFLENQK